VIDTKPVTTQCAGPGCEHQVVWIPGHKKRFYCSDVCRQRAHRAKERQPAGNVTVVTIDEKQDLEQRIAQLERENAKLRALRSTRTSQSLRHGYIERVMTWGEKLHFQPLTVSLYVGEGLAAWETFMKEANEKLLIRLIIAAERADEKSKQS
jgi:hypothetical protein